MSELCNAYYEEFAKASKLADLCEVCGIVGGRHSRAPVTVSVPAVSASSSLGKIVIPKWTNQSVCKVFLQDLQRNLKAHGKPKSVWPNYLLMSVEDSSAGAWVEKNILDENLSWENACVKFTNYFQKTDYSVELERKWLKNKHAPNEPVRIYFQRCRDYISQLGYDPDDKHVISTVVNNIK